MVAARNATTRSDAGASNSPAPTLAVGKWLAAVPIDTCWRTAPLEGSSPYNTPLRPTVHTKPAATIGGPPPTAERHLTSNAGGDALTCRAIGPVTHGRYTVVPTTAVPPSMSSPQPEARLVSWPPIPPRCEPSSR